MATKKATKKRKNPTRPSLGAMFKAYEADTQQGGVRSNPPQSFIGWMRRHGVDPATVSEEDYLKFYRSRGMSEDEAIEYLESQLEGMVMSG